MAVNVALKSAGFEDNPFRIVPPGEMDNVIWAGDTSIIDELTEAARSPRADALGTSEFLVLFGDFGSGKTNALKYLTKVMRQEDALVAFLVRPSVADKPNWHDIARSLFTQAFRKEDVASRLGPLRKYVLSEARARAVAELGENDGNIDALESLERVKVKQVASEVLPEAPGFVEFALDLAYKKKDRNWSYLANKPSTAGKEISSEYNMPVDGMESDYGATLLLSSLVRTLTYPTPFGVGTEVVCILMDEVEGIPELSPASRSSILQGIRDLFNACTEHLFIAVAATASDASEMWGILDTPLMQRLSRAPVQFATLEALDAKEFVLGVMDYHRAGDFSGDRAWPFSDAGLDAFLEACPPPLTPRKLLVSAGRLVFQKNLTKVASGQSIEPEDVYDFSSWGAT